MNQLSELALTTKPSAVVSALNKDPKHNHFVASLDTALEASFGFSLANLKNLELESFSEEFWNYVFSRAFRSVVVAVCDNPVALVVRAWFVLLFYSKTTDQWKKGEAPTVATIAAGHFDASCGVAVADKIVKGLSVPKCLKPFVKHVENNTGCLVDFIGTLGDALDLVANDAASPNPELTASARANVLSNAFVRAMETAGHTVDNVEAAVIKSMRNPLALSREGVERVGAQLDCASEQDLSGFSHEQQPIPEEDEGMADEEDEEDEEEVPQTKPQAKPKPPLRNDGRCNATSQSSGQRCKKSVSDRSAADDIRGYFCTAMTHRNQADNFAPLPTV